MAKKHLPILEAAKKAYSELPAKNPHFVKPTRLSRVTAILEFEVIKPTNHFESVGERLKLSMFGEYCPDRSMRGYQLYDLLTKPKNYKPSVIIQRGEIIKL